MSKFKPILFSTPMVKAILDGRKTMTRRIIKFPKNWVAEDNAWDWATLHEYYPKWGCKYKVEDVLWVRETFYKSEHNEEFYYKSNFKVWDASIKWKPSIFMPKSACRIFLEITDVRVERLQEISEEDAINEGIEQTFFGEIFNAYKNYINDGQGSYQPIGSFKSLWQSINGNWEENPFVWVVEFKKIENPTDFN